MTTFTANAGAPASKLASSFGSNGYTESSIWTVSNGQLIRKSLAYSSGRLSDIESQP